MLTKAITHIFFDVPKSSFGDHTFWENREKAGLSKMGMSCRRLELSTHPFEKCFENAFPNVRSAFHNLRLGSIKSRLKYWTNGSPQDDTCPTNGIRGMHLFQTRNTTMQVLSSEKFTLPKRRFWKVEPTFPNAFSKYFSRA